MKALQPLFAKNARRSSSTCCSRQTKQWTQHTIVFSFQLFCFAKSRICAYFTVNVQIIRIHALCFILREFCSKIKPQKERWNVPFILARARSRLCRLLVINKLAPRWVKLSAEARTLMEGDIGLPNTAIPYQKMAKTEIPRGKSSNYRYRIF